MMKKSNDSFKFRRLNKITQCLQIILIGFSSLLLNACQTGLQPDSVSTIHIATDSCLSVPKHHYEIAVPQLKDKPQEKLPLLILIDSHGDGKYALKHFKDAINSYPMIVAASDLIKNNFSGFISAIDTLIHDVHRKYPVSQTIWIAGFSGGARMALDYALNHPVNGLILSGALASSDQLNHLNCPVISISGMNDFNFSETAQYLLGTSRPDKLKIILTNAAHGWPAPSILKEGTALLAFKNSSVSYSKKVFSQFEQEELTKIDSLISKNDLLKACLTASNISPSKHYQLSDKFKRIYLKIKNSEQLKNEQLKLRQTLQTEAQAKQKYYQNLLQKDTLWWRKEKVKLNQNKQQISDPFEHALYERIQGFWGIACYSLSRQAMLRKDRKLLQQITPIYRLLEPDNPDAYYYSAFVPYWNKQTRKTVALLQQAKQKGFSDSQKLHVFPQMILNQLQ